MFQASPLLGIIVVGIGLAFVLGTIANRLRISPIVGYLLAGVAVGPFTPGFVADAGLAPQLAQIGVILLMFGVGLHFSLKDLLSVWRIVVPAALAQMVGATLIGALLVRFLGWDMVPGIVFGLALSVASTVVLTRALQDRRLLDTQRGRVAIAWLVVQDLLTVIALVLLPPLAAALQAVQGSADGGIDVAGLIETFGLTILRLAAFLGLMLVVGRRVIPAILHYMAHTGSRELFRLAVLSVALVVAFVAANLFGVSIALGAFFAGMILSESELSQRAAEETLPLRDAFAVLFFVSIGMLFNPMVLIGQPLPLLAALVVVIVGNGGMAFLMMRAFGYSLPAALTVAAGLTQIGEFSFILADLGIGLGLLPERARDLILGTSILSIFANPLLFAALERLRPLLMREPKDAPAAPPGKVAEEILVPTTLKNHAVLVGYGRVGRLIANDLLLDGWPLLVIETANGAFEQLRAAGVETIAGNAAEDRILAAANLAEARVLLVAIPDGFEAGQIVQQARAANPQIEIIARAHFDAEVDHLLRHGATIVVMGEREIARTMLDRTRALSSAVATS